ncbi:MAG: TRC40/GET3/ArsA family transport-energizing ATPase [Candidatus Lokiarchaeota archaeon]|nr:TRC40/GET3/ArsA family transport-energizing ATPase [Candidatus Lokiarchaeota archaeon]
MENMNLPEMLLSLKIIMFGGKGGVGKTTCASSSAIWTAEHGRNTLIISTDPAHSLGDSFGIVLPPGEPTKIPGVERLTALEIDPKADMSEYKGLTIMSPVEGTEMPDIMGGLPMMEDLQDITSMSPPGIDEAFALLKVLEFIETDHDYDLVIFDTAPTGHTLRFLSLPETLSGWIGKLLKMRLKLGNLMGLMKSLFTSGGKKKDNSLEVLERLKDSIIRARDDLTNPMKNSFVVVMIPEEMAISETGRLLNELLKYNIPVSNIVVNQLYQDEDDLCDFCRSRRKMQASNLLKIQKVFRDELGKNLIEIPLFRGEIREYDNLKIFGEKLVK